MPAKTHALSKEEIFARVFHSAMTLDFRKGHQRWTISELSRHSGVTRSLVYYYFGRSRVEILNEAVRCLGEELFGLSAHRMMLWSTGQIVDSVLLSRRFVQGNPDLAAFYMLHRFRESDIGMALRKLEQRHHEKVMKFFPHTPENENRARSAMLFGLVFAAGVSDDQVRSAVQILSRK